VNYNKKWQNRAVFISVSFLLFAVSLTIIFKVFNSNIVFFYSPSEFEPSKQIDKSVRVGGLVKDGSIHYLADNETLEFIITDYRSEMTVNYRGITPTLFKEGQGTIALGKYSIDESKFYAKELLAKHDENYMPPEVYKSLNKNKSPSKENL